MNKTKQLLATFLMTTTLLTPMNVFANNDVTQPNLDSVISSGGNHPTEDRELTREEVVNEKWINEEDDRVLFGEGYEKFNSVGSYKWMVRDDDGYYRPRDEKPTDDSRYFRAFVINRSAVGSSIGGYDIIDDDGSVRLRKKADGYKDSTTGREMLDYDTTRLWWRNNPNENYGYLITGFKYGLTESEKAEYNANKSELKKYAESIDLKKERFNNSPEEYRKRNREINILKNLDNADEVSESFFNNGYKFFKYRMMREKRIANEALRAEALKNCGCS